METSFQNKLIKILKSDSRFIDQDGELVKAAIIDRAWKIDRNLVKLLLSDASIKQKFFKEIEGHWIFNVNIFIDYVSDKDFLDNSYTRFRNKIGLNIDGKYLKERGEVCLVWPHKDCILEGGQTKEEESRKEVFFNEILAQDEIDRLLDPKILTNWKRYSTKGEEELSEIKRDENNVIKENLLIKGNNLLTLHCLKQQYMGKVKLIYIDPPYNTGGSTDTFCYNSSFKHSAWLTFMKNRIEISKELLTEDGFIAVTIDHVELFYLGALLDEIFGRDNQVGIVTIYINPKGRQHERFFAAATEYMLVYAKNISLAEFNKVALDEDKIKSFKMFDDTGNYRLEQFIRARTSTLRESKPNFWYPIYVSNDLEDITLVKKEGYYEVFPIKNGREYSWKTKADTFEKRNTANYFIAKEESGAIVIYHKYYEQQVFKNIWIDKKYFPEFQGTNLLKKLMGENVFSYPKSLYAVLDTIKIMTNDDDIILDFFGGSGTTAHAVLCLNKQDSGNRRFIICEQMDYVESVTRERIKKVIENDKFGHFIYFELMKYNQVYMDKIQASKTTNELVEIWKDISQYSFLNWYINATAPDDALHDFVEIGKSDNGVEKQKGLLCELLNKNQLYVNLSEIEDIKFSVSEHDKELNKQFYGETYNA